MINVLALEICESEHVLRVFGIINLLIVVCKIIVPLLIMFKTGMDLFQAVIASNDEKIKKATSALPKRLIAGIAIFFIPSIVNYFFDTMVHYQDTASAFAGCTTCLTESAQCEDLIKTAHAQAEAERKILNENQTLTSDPSLVHTKDDDDPGDQQTTQPVQTTTVGNGKYFDSEDVTKISGLSEQEFIQVLENSTAYKGKAKVYIPLAHDLILAEQNHSVNAFYLIGLYSYESGWLGSTLTKKCNNIGGVRYYGRTYGNGKKQTNCWNNYAGFDSIAEFIDFHANMLQTRYLTPGAPHYNGTSVAAIAKDYGAGNGIDTIIRIATNVSGGNASGK